MDSNTKKAPIHILHILDNLYENVETLYDFVKSLNCAGDDLLISNNRIKYVDLLFTTLVCTPPGVRRPDDILQLPQLSHQSEIILRVVEKIRKRECHSTNLLTLGYSRMSNNPAAQISTSRNVEYSFPNQNTSRLLHGPWKTLLSQIGDMAMEYLLEMSIFVSVTPTCYMQLSGKPLYELWSFKTFMQLPGMNKIGFRQLYPILLNSSKNKRKAKIRHVNKEAKDESLDRRNIVHDIDCVCQQCNGICTDISKQCGNLVKTNPGRKRVNKFGMEKQEYIPQKKVCMSVLKGSSVDTVFCSLQTKEDDPVIGTNRYMYSTTGGNNCQSEQDVFGITINEPILINEDTARQCCSENVRSLLHRPIDIANQNHDNREGKTQTVLKNVEEECKFTGVNNTVSTEFGIDCSTTKLVNKKKRSRIGKNHNLENTNGPAFSHKIILDRTRMFYSKDLIEKFPPKYVVFDVGEDHLVNEIFAEVVTEEKVTNQSEIQYPSCVDAVKKMLKDKLRCMIQNHKSCRYKILLRNYSKHSCKVRKKEMPTENIREVYSHERVAFANLNGHTYKRGFWTSGKNVPLANKSKYLKRRPNNVSVRRLLEMYFTHRDVYLFVRACCIHVIPHDMFGSDHNQKTFLKNVSKIIGMGRFDKFALGHLMANMKVRKCSWLKPVKSNRDRLRIMAQFIYWLIKSYVFKVILSYFYITETANYRNCMFYFRKATWVRIQQKALFEYLRRGIVQPCSHAEVNANLQNDKLLGVAVLRFLPKVASLRPIVNMCKRQPDTNLKDISINHQLKNVQHILVHEKNRNPDVIGSSKFSLDDIYISWKRFVLKRHERKEKRHLYFVKLDIENCYDSIDLCKLYETVKNLVKESKEYIVRRYAVVTTAGDRLRRTFHRDPTTLDDFIPSFYQFLKNYSERRNIQNAIFVDQVLHMQENAEDVLKKLYKHLFYSIIKIGKRYYRQVKGIGQGSIISTMLCNLYYGRMEADYIDVDVQDELLMRQVDDFIFVTPSYSNAVRFLELMMHGIPEYNCTINKEKTLINFDYFDEGVKRLPDGALFPWCGLLFDTVSLCVKSDYTRYAGLSVADTISIDTTQQAGYTMKNKLVLSLHRKCHCIFLDTSFNSVVTVAENIYKLFLLTAFKFHHYVHQLPMSESTLKNPEFFINLIFELPNIVTSHSQLTAMPSHMLLQPACTQWLCLKAFLLKLSIHRTTYNCVFKALRSRCASLEKIMDKKLLFDLTALIGNEIPPEFQLIFY